MEPNAPTLVLMVGIDESAAARYDSILEANGWHAMRAETVSDLHPMLQAFPETQAVVIGLDILGDEGIELARHVQNTRFTGVVLHRSSFGPELAEALQELDGCQYFLAGSGDFLLVQAVRAACGRTGSTHIREDLYYQGIVSEMHQGLAIHEAVHDKRGRICDFRFIDVNASYERITGLPRSQIVGRTIREILPRTQEYWIQLYSGIATTGSIRHFEKYVEDIGKHLEFTAYRPRPDQFALVINDVTSRKEQETRQHDERRLFERLVETSPAGIVMTDRHGHVVFSNAQADSLFRIQPGSNKYRQYNSPAWHTTNLSGGPLTPQQLPFHQLMASQAPVSNLQYGLVWPDGQRILISVNAAPLFDPDGAFDGMVATYNNITERIRAETVLRVSEDRFRNLADSGMALIWAAGAERRCTFFNKPWLDFTGRALEQELGAGWTAGLHPDDLSHCLNTYRSAWNERSKFSMDYRLRRRDGTYRWIQDDGAPCFDSTGAFTGYIGHCLDITDHKLAISRINILLSEKELLLKEVHHRIKNNMSSIMGLLTLQAQKVDNPIVTSALEGAINRIGSMSILYDKLYRTPEFRQISLRDYLPSLVQEIRQTFPRYPAVRFELQVENLVVPVNTVVPLGIIVNELITNAMKYAFRGRPSGSIRLEAKREERFVRISLADDGPGLPDGCPAADCAGFGLQLCHQLTAELGGSIETAPPPGTNWIIRLPLS
jgi:PAS domain S-box-containing protein